jgi:hypothetical protein
MMESFELVHPKFVHALSDLGDVASFAHDMHIFNWFIAILIWFTCRWLVYSNLIWLTLWTLFGRTFWTRSRISQRSSTFDMISMSLIGLVRLSVEALNFGGPGKLPLRFTQFSLWNFFRFALESFYSSDDSTTPHRDQAMVRLKCKDRTLSFLARIPVLELDASRSGFHALPLL